MREISLVDQPYKQMYKHATGVCYITNYSGFSNR